MTKPFDLKRFLLEDTFKTSIEREIPGTLGLVYVFAFPENHSPRRFAVKTVDPARVKPGRIGVLEKFAHEIRHWIRYRHHPLIITPFFTEFVQEWPYVAMPYCEATLRACIAGEATASSVERVALMVQVAHALRYAADRGLVVHQDLKPENILLQDLRTRYSLPPDYAFNWRPRVADFGNANAYKELGVPWGSRPYMAPEQYDAGADVSRCDIFACGVMLYELLTGLHPVGVKTQQVWPSPLTGESRQWRREQKWRRWARASQKLKRPLGGSLLALEELLQAVFDTDPARRPDLAELEAAMLDYLRRTDENAHVNLSMLLVHYDQTCSESEAFGEDDERYQQRLIDALIAR